MVSLDKSLQRQGSILYKEFATKASIKPQKYVSDEDNMQLSQAKLLHPTLRSNSGL